MAALLPRSPRHRVRDDNDLLHPVYRVTATFRWLLLADALVVNHARLGQVAHRRVLVAACAVMIAWTALAGWCQARARTRTWLVMGSDVVVTLALVVAGRWVLGAGLMAASHISLPVLWVGAAPLTIAVWRGGLYGLVAALLLASAQFVQDPEPDVTAWTWLVVTGVAAWGVGALVDTLRDSLVARQAEQARAAALAERDRLNRIVHDGALQVLAMVEREGPDLGPRGRELARLAHQQEIALRSLLAGGEPAAAPLGTVDLVAVLQRHASPTVTVSATCDRLDLDAHRAGELDAAVAEALANVARHAGAGARAWVFLDEDDDELLVTVRDDGAGADPADLEAARARGRLGVAGSIRGRVAALGGSAEVTARPGRGVEWELRVPAAPAVQGFSS